MTNTKDTRKNIAVLFGGRSVEHEISIITALQLIESMDTVVYNPVPVYVATSGKWYTGSELLKREFYKGLPGSLESLTEVALLPTPNVGGLKILPKAQKPKMFNFPGSRDKEQETVVPVDVYLPAFHGSYGEDGCIQGLFELADVPYVGCNVVSASMGMNKYHSKMYLKSHDIPVLPSVILTKDEIDPTTGGSLKTAKEKIKDFKRIISEARPDIICIQERAESHMKYYDEMENVINNYEKQLRDQ